MCRVCARTFVRANSGFQTTEAPGQSCRSQPGSKASASARPLSAQPSSETLSGKLPLQWLVSTSTRRGRPARPSATTIQSWPGTRFRRVSQPPPMVFERPGKMRLSLGPK